MTRDIERETLRRLYEAYDELTRGFARACVRGCSVCCTHNVLATSLEARLVLEALGNSGREDLLAKALQGTGAPWLRPAMTINALAESCVRQEEAADTPQDFEIRTCPLREDHGCPVYEARPFSCRAMWSTRLCSPGGEAFQDPFLVSLNGVFQQILENLDSGGLCGNMLDLLAFLSDPEEREAFQSGQGLQPTKHLLHARPNPGFVVPREHRPRMAQVLVTLKTRGLAPPINP